MGRTIVFGDIHGCYEEWQELMSSLAVTSSDKLIAVGDLICKGPSTRKTLDLAMSIPNLTCLVGNHELRFLTCWREGRKADIRSYDEPTARDMGDRFEAQMKYISTWPFYVELPEAIVVHAGLRPGVPLERQSEVDLTHLRRVGADERPWYDLYEGKKLVVFGHWVRRKPLVRDNAIGLDTGCVYGGSLSAVVLPERRIVSMKARKEHTEKKGDWA
jgi:hypothetical protein